MISFPHILNILKQRLACEIIRTGSKIQIPETLFNTVEKLRIIHQGASGRVYEPMFLVENGWTDEDQEILNRISKNVYLQNHASWIYSEIILNAKKDNWITTNVKIRIITTALEGFLPKNLYLHCCDALIENVRELKLDLTNEELPF